MVHTIKTFLTYPQASFSRSLSSKFCLCREPSTVRFCTKPDTAQNMDKAQKPNREETKHGDVMSHSFGEGYATRCDEEGFGGIYGENQSLNTNQKDKSVHENHPDYDKTQGSEVKEKEKGRHQTNANA
ncbi:uncharacterized protein [Cicer arietinum]|uniref:Uncharacterized protein LOC101500608 n=1 Tax=Cicer arietinum TaxID=3827 RepID=A0A1S2YYQ7_CICAR|nr:uncharacterized protein LOC101500608 [Cicer arietinum]